MTLAAIEPFNWNNLVTLLIAVLVAWNTYRSQKRDKKVDVLSEHVNGMKDALVTAVKVASKAEGKQEERDEERHRVEARLLPTEVVVVNEPSAPIPTNVIKK